MDDLSAGTVARRRRDDEDELAREWLQHTETKLAALVGRLPAPAQRFPCCPDIRIRHEREQYLKLIAACNEAIVAGETYEVCLTNMVEARGAIDPWHSYRALRSVNPDSVRSACCVVGPSRS